MIDTAVFTFNDESTISIAKILAIFHANMVKLVDIVHDAQNGSTKYFVEGDFIELRVVDDMFRELDSWYQSYVNGYILESVPAPATDF